MQTPRPARPARKDLWFRCGRYFARTIKREDASDRWAGWLSDPWAVHVLNSPPRTLQKSDIADYIKQFDQRSQLLLGIFEMGTRLHVGFVRLDIDHAAREALVNAVIGEPEHRNRGATTDVFVPVLDFLFDEVGIKRVRASILLRNQVTLRYLLKLGWQKDETAETPVKSHADGTSIDRCSVSWTRDGYRAFRHTTIGSRILNRLSDAERRPARGPASTA
ncbi:MAG: GNAT family N-acetyltransferase [Xanthobacteraceae bacterium]